LESAARASQAALVQVADPSGLELADPGTGGIEHE
jgi:hypothetical protein